MQTCDGQKSARDRQARHANRPQNPSNSFRRYVVSTGRDEPSMQGDEVGYAEEIWHSLKMACGPSWRNALTRLSLPAQHIVKMEHSEKS
jgi:hypothetical protein